MSRVLTPLQELEVIELLKTRTVREVANHYGVTLNVIYRIRTKHKVNYAEKISALEKLVQELRPKKIEIPAELQRDRIARPDTDDIKLLTEIRNEMKYHSEIMREQLELFKKLAKREP